MNPKQIINSLNKNVFNSFASGNIFWKYSKESNKSQLLFIE